MKKILAFLLAISLVLTSLGTIPQVEAAEYTDVTLTDTLDWASTVSGDNWILYLETTGYTSTDWSYKYKGFTYECNGVEGTTTQVSSTEDNRLYCTIPTSAVSTDDGTVVTIKAGQYAPDDAGTTKGINITKDFKIAVIGGHLVAPVLDVATVEPFNHSASTFYFSLKDANGDKIVTGLESWTNFLSPAWYNGTRVDSGDWASVYSGIFVDGQSVTYAGWPGGTVCLKNTGEGEFYIEGLSAVQGTTLTIRGFFATSKQVDWAIDGSFYIPELSFTYNGSSWEYIKVIEYSDVTLTNTQVESSTIRGDEWILYLNTEGYTSTDWSYKYQGFTYEIDGVPGTTTQVSSTEANRLYCTIPTSAIPTDDGTVFTIKAGQYAPDDGGTTKGINITKDFKIAVIGGHLVTPVLDVATVEPFNHSASTFYFSLKDANGDKIVTGLESWTNFLSPAWYNGTRVDSGDWASVYSGIFVDGQPVTYAGWSGGTVCLKNTVEGEFYIEGLSAVQGTTLTIRGFFATSKQADWAIDGSFYIPELKFTYDGSTWSYVEPDNGPTITDHNGTPVFESSQADGFYFTAGETAFPYPAEGEPWNIVATPEDENSGISLSQDGGTTYKKLTVNLQKVGEDRWFAYMAGDTSVTLQPGDMALLKGAFIYENHRITFSEAKFIWDGTVWGEEVVVDEDNIEFSLDRNTDGGGTKAGIRLTATDSVPYDLGWGTNTNACVGVDNGVFLNDVKTEVFLKKYESNKYYVCLSDVGVEPKDGDTVTVKGAFKTNDYVSSYQEYTLTFKNGMWLDESDLQPVEVKEKNVKLTLDQETFGWQAGSEAGIYLFTEDHFAVDANWRTPIYAVAYDDNSGIFFNGKKAHTAYLKKHADGMIYLDIAAAGIFAEDMDTVTIKGTFVLDGYAVSYAERTFYYNGQKWDTTYSAPLPRTLTKLSPIEVSKPSSFNPERKAWDIYVKVDGAIPGGHDYEYKTLIYEVNGKSYETSVYRVEDKLVFFVPETVVPKDAADGTAITLKAGVACDNYGIYDIELTKDCTAYVYRKAISGIKPTDNTPFMGITIPGLIRTWSFNEEIKEWQLFFIVEEKFDVEDGTQYYDLPVKLNGKSYEEINVFRSGECLYISIPESVLPRNTKSASLTIAKGAKAVANAGWNGIRLNNEVKAYMFDGVWNNIEFKEAEVTDLTIKHMNFCSYNSDISRWDIYVNVDKEILGTAWFEYFEGLTAYLNGKEFTTYANKAESENNRLLYISLSEDVFGKFKDGDILYIPGDVIWSCGGYKINNTRDFYLQYVNGTWMEYYESDVEAPEELGSVWEKFRIDGYIPVQEEDGIMFTNVEPNNMMKSVEDMKDVTFSFETKKMMPMNEELPTNSFVLRGKPIAEGMDVSETALYGYNISFSYIELTESNMPNNPELWGTHSQQVEVWKNGINYNLLDQYRMTYNWQKTNHPFFKYDETYKYTVSIYNVEEDVCVIEVYCNDELVMRVVDHASDDPLDPARNAGEFRIYSACPQYFYAPEVELDTLEASATECYLGEQVRVSATYPAVLDGAEYSLEGESEGVTLKDGVFSATKVGTYTVRGSYNGEDKGTVQIKVMEKAVENDTVEGTSNLPIVPIAIAGGLILVAAAIACILFLKKKKNS